MSNSKEIVELNQKVDKAEKLLVEVRTKLLETKMKVGDLDVELLLTDVDYRIYIALLKFNGNKRKAADYLGSSIRTLFRHMDSVKSKYGDI